MRGAVIAACLLFASCAPSGVGGPETVQQLISPEATTAPAPVRAATADRGLSTIAEPPLPSRLRVFVAAEGKYFGGTGELYVLEAKRDGMFEVVNKIPQGGWPHNVSVSPDGRYVAVANRSSSQVSIVDPLEMRELARVGVGKQPHAILWHPDGKTLFVGAERDSFITRIEAGTWRLLPPLQVGTPQHVFLMRADRPSELWFTATFFGQVPYQDDHLRMYDLTTGKIAKVKVYDVHDAYFTPDGSEIWSSSSGFLEKPSDRMVIYDPIERKVKAEVRFPGRYPFHTLKRFHDGMYYPPDTSIMVLSSHYSAEKGKNGSSLLWVDWKARKILDETPIGRHSFHSTYDPLGGRLLTTSNIDGMVNVIDWETRQIVQKIAVPKAHGIVAVGIP